MKRMVLAVLAFFIMTATAACTSAGDPESFDGSLDPEISGYKTDMNGYLFKIACYLHGFNKENALNPSSDFEVRSDKLVSRYNQIKADHNCDFQISNGVDMNAVKTYHFAGDIYADTILEPAGTIFEDGYVRAGMFIPWNYIEEIDITDERYGSEKVKQANMWLGECYGIDARYLQMPCADTMAVMYINPTTIRKYSQPMPFDLYENGQWDWAHLEDMCHAIWDVTSSDKNEWVVAMGYNNVPYLEFACVYSNGGRFATQTESGRLVYTFDSQNTKHAMEFLSNLRAEGYIIDDEDRFNIDPFCENRRAFFFGFSHLGLYTESTNNFSTRMEEEFDWITFPQGPDADGTEVCSRYSWWSRHFYLPSNVNYDYIGAVIPELFDFLPGENKDNWEKDFYAVNFYSERSFEFYKKFRDDAEFDFSVFCDYNSINNMLLSMIRGTTSISQGTAEIAGLIQNGLDERYNIPHGYTY